MGRLTDHRTTESRHLVQPPTSRADPRSTLDLEVVVRGVVDGSWLWN